MKRSTNVALTLLVPAMAAFGCSQQPTPQETGRALIGQGPGGHAAAGEKEEWETNSDCDLPAKPGEPDKTPCNSPESGTGSAPVGHARSTGGYIGRRSYFPFFFGGFRSGGMNTAPSHSSTGTRPSQGTGTSTGTSQPHSSGTSSSSVTHGGFGGTGSHLSGGS